MSKAEKSTAVNQSNCLQPTPQILVVEKNHNVPLVIEGTHRIFITTFTPYTKDEVMALPEVEGALQRAGIISDSYVVIKAERGEGKNMETGGVYYIHTIDVEVKDWQTAIQEFKLITVHINKKGQYIGRSTELGKRTNYSEKMPSGTQIYVRFQSEQVHKIHEVPELLSIIPDITGEVIGCEGFNPDANIIPDIRLYKLFLKSSSICFATENAQLRSKIDSLTNEIENKLNGNS